MKKDPVPILTHALACEGGCAYKLAAALSVAPSTVYRWIKSGPPMRKANAMVQLYAKRRAPKNPLEWKPKEKA